MISFALAGTATATCLLHCSVACHVVLPWKELAHSAAQFAAFAFEALGHMYQQKARHAFRWMAPALTTRALNNIPEVLHQCTTCVIDIPALSHHHALLLCNVDSTT